MIKYDVYTICIKHISIVNMFQNVNNSKRLSQTIWQYRDRYIMCNIYVSFYRIKKICNTFGILQQQLIN